MTAHLPGITTKRLQLVGSVVAIGLIGSWILTSTHAASSTASLEAENGAANTCANAVSDTTASNSGAVKFATCASSGTNPSADAGASLPISYSLSALSGTVIYVATDGSDAGSGTVGSPYATLSKALTAAASGSTIVLRGGTYYNQGGLKITKSVKVIAYPGETPVFDGSTAASSGWTTSGSLSYRAYTPIAPSSGSGIDFTASPQPSQLAGDGVGKYPDQAWIGNTQIEQVSTQAEVTTGTFYVDETNSRLYMQTSDLSGGKVSVSSQRTFASVSAANVTLDGFEVIRYSNTASDYGVINFAGGANNGLLQNMYESDTAFIAIAISVSGTTVNQGTTIKDSTILYSNWMGVSANGTTNFTLDHDNISNMNQWGEFNSSPQSGSLKTSRTWNTTVKNSKIMNDKTVGLWFDQSNYNMVVANNDIENNTGSGIFFEISDYAYAINNYIKTSGSKPAIEISATADAYLVNNTLVGGHDPLGVYVDSRGYGTCAQTYSSSCGSLNSDYDSYHSPSPATLTWQPGINLMVNNIIAYPTASGFCSVATDVCITHTNGNSTVDIGDIIHGADSANNVPQSIINGNVYANGSGTIFDSLQLGKYATVSAITSGLAAAPVSIGGMESSGLAGNSYVGTDGTPSSSLAALHGSAAAVPTQSTVNTYVPANTKHYGVTWK